MTKPKTSPRARRSKPAARAQQILHAIDQGLNNTKAIAEALGLSRSTVWQIARAHPDLITVHEVPSVGRTGTRPIILTRAGEPCPLPTEADWEASVLAILREHSHCSLTFLCDRARPLSVRAVRVILDRLVTQGEVVRRVSRSGHHHYAPVDRAAQLDAEMADEAEADGWQPGKWVHPYRERVLGMAS